MGKGNISGIVSSSRGDESEKTTPSFECDVGLGLKMEQLLPTPSLSAFYELTSGVYGCHADFGPLFCNVTNLLACVNNFYNVVGAAPFSVASVLPTTLHPFSPDTSIRSLGEGMAAFGKVALTVSQYQELERQMMIYKYMMASTPVPHQLLLPITTNPSHVPSFQSNSNKSLVFMLD